MKTKTILHLSQALLLSAFMLTSCTKDDVITATTPTTGRTLDADLGIEAVPGSLGNTYTANFNGYTKVTTPNGGAIHIVAQDRITNEQMIRCRSVLEHYLKNLPSSVYGADKSAVANKMAANGAILNLLNGRDDGSNTLEVDGQPLYEEEIQVEGHTWYMTQDFDMHRDATYEEIVHLVHDTGIGVDGANTRPGALPTYQTEIRAAQVNAFNNNLWGIGLATWISELTVENSLSQEYLAGIIDSYYGLAGADPGAQGTNGTPYKTRAGLAAQDPMGNELMNNKFFHSYITYNARIDANLTGNFSLKFDASKPYTNHSQYLKDITLLGSNDNTITVNQMDNNITGNSGSNTVIFSGNMSEYTVSTSSGTTTVTDNTADRDGENTLTAVQKLQFADQTLDL